MRIYIGNLSKMTTARHLAELFQSFGAVTTSKIVSDEKTGHSLGFGYIEMEQKCAKRAIEKLHRFLFMNFYMEVNEVY